MKHRKYEVKSEDSRLRLVQRKFWRGIERGYMILIRREKFPSDPEAGLGSLECCRESSQSDMTNIAHLIAVVSY
jgi:glutamine phosphoribosylpyrophosphate amidotransferase